MSSRSEIRRSRLSSPTTTSMSSASCWPSTAPASSSAWPSAIVIGVRSWCAASCRNRRWSSSSLALCSLISAVRPVGRQPPVGVPGHRQEHQRQQRVLGQLGGRLGPDRHVKRDADRGHHQHRARHPEGGSPVPGAEPVDERQARPDEVERDGLPGREHEHEVEVDQGEDRPHDVDRAGRVRPAETGQRALAASPPPQPGHELIALTPHGLDQVEAELGAESADAHVDHVGPRVEVVAPDGGEQLALGDRVPGVLRELAQQQELQPGEVHRAVADVRHQPGHVEGDLAGPDHLAAQPAPAPGRAARPARTAWSGSPGRRARADRPWWPRRRRRTARSRPGRGGRPAACPAPGGRPGRASPGRG